MARVWHDPIPSAALSRVRPEWWAAYTRIRGLGSCASCRLRRSAHGAGMRSLYPSSGRPFARLRRPRCTVSKKATTPTHPQRASVQSTRAKTGPRKFGSLTHGAGPVLISKTAFHLPLASSVRARDQDGVLIPAPADCSQGAPHSSQCMVSRKRATRACRPGPWPISRCSHSVFARSSGVDPPGLGRQALLLRARGSSYRLWLAVLGGSDGWRPRHARDAHTASRRALGRGCGVDAACETGGPVSECVCAVEPSTSLS